MKEVINVRFAVPPQYRQYKNTPYYVSERGFLYRLFPAKKNIPKRLKQTGQCLDTCGYYRILLSGVNAPKHRGVHRIVAEVFHGPPPSPDHQVNHKNGVKTDNRPENLEWVTRKGNAQHAIQTGLKKTKLTPEDVLYIRTSDKSGAELGRQFGVNKTTISKTRLGKRWKTIGGTTHASSSNKKLNPDQVADIRRSPLGYKRLAAIYGVGRTTIQDVVKGRSYRDVK